MKSKYVFFALLLFSSFPVFAQDDLLDLLDETDESVNYVIATFKGTRIINGHSTKLRNKKALEFLISHRFGRINNGIYEFFGLDEANIRLALEYGITDVLNIGVGRSSFDKTYDGFVKWKFLRQKTGEQRSPVSMVLFSSYAINSVRSEGQNINFADRIGYTFQLLIARKFNSNFSFQLIPGMVHLNSVPSAEDDNDIYYLGGGLRYKLTRSLALTMEYYHRFNPLTSTETFDLIGIGIDIETGGHVFQLMFTNTNAPFEKGFITETVDDFLDGDIRFGFNISRTFQLGQKRNW